MIAQSRVHSIVDLAIVIPVRWLAAYTHLLGPFDWSARSMGRVVDKLETLLPQVVGDGALFLDEGFMMSIFDEFVSELPPFKQFLKELYEKKTMPCIGIGTGKAVPMSVLRHELFEPGEEANAATDALTATLGAIAAEGLLEELRDVKKATAAHLSSMEGELSWGATSDDQHEAAMGKMAVNDPAECTFAGLTRQLECFGRISLRSAGAVSQAQYNGDFGRGHSAKRHCAGSTSKAVGVFHTLSSMMTASMLTVGLEDAPATRQDARLMLAKQRAVRQKKEELARTVALASAREEHIDALYYYAMFSSAACWKTAAAVDRELAKLKSVSARLEALKENIRMRVDGLGWDDLSTPWSKDGKAFSVAYLSAHLKKIIAERRSIPAKPRVPTLTRKALPTLGAQSSDVQALDEKQAADNDAFEAESRRVLAERGIGDLAGECQPRVQPTIASLPGKRIEICCVYNIQDDKGMPTGETEARWSAGSVVRVADGREPHMYDFDKNGKSVRIKAGEGVMIRWDADPVRGEPESESAKRLLPSKWNPKQHSDGAWRFDT